MYKALHRPKLPQKAREGTFFPRAASKEKAHEHLCIVPLVINSDKRLTSHLRTLARHIWIPSPSAERRSVPRKMVGDALERKAFDEQ
ncbi:mCG13335 [Mus musculus]|nr:mCG13335 [Mus musculus]